MRYTSLSVARTLYHRGTLPCSPVTIPQHTNQRYFTGNCYNFNCTSRRIAFLLLNFRFCIIYSYIQKLREKSKLFIRVKYSLWYLIFAKLASQFLIQNWLQGGCCYISSQFAIDYYE